MAMRVSAMRAWLKALGVLRDQPTPGQPIAAPARAPRRQPRRPSVLATTLALDLAPGDPLAAYCLAAPGVVDIDRLQLDSPTLRAWQAAQMRLALPLISQGELIGMITLGPRAGGEEYSADDLAALTTLATQVAPAVRVAQLAQEQQTQARERERLEHELDVARLIQQTLLPKAPPELPGWKLAAYYQPARAVGGDFHDFLALPHGRLGLVIGDVTDKGTPAALLMATTRSILRAAALGGATPGATLERTNDLLHHDIPPRMFVTCLYATLEPQTGLLRFANAGHNLPLWRHDGMATPLRASGMPLGLMPGMRYEEQTVTLAADDSVLLYSDGLVEAHGADRAMFGQSRLATLLAQPLADQALIDHALAELAEFVGADWEQEDDVTLVTLRALRAPGAYAVRSDADVRAQRGIVGAITSRGGGTASAPHADHSDHSDHSDYRDHTEIVGDREAAYADFEAGADDARDARDTRDARDARDARDDNDEGATGGDESSHWRTLGEWTTPSHHGDERLAMAWVAETFAPLALPTATLERLKTAVAEATMNAMEHGNQRDPTRLVYLEALASPTAVAVRVGDEGAGGADHTPPTPNLAAKLTGEESPRGWGLFLIRQLVDEVHAEVAHGRHAIRLVIARATPTPHATTAPAAQPQEERDVRHSS